jgi:hypothetical protein
LIEVRVVGKRPAVDEIVPQVADRTLDRALGLRAVGPTRARREAPVVREAQKLELADGRAALQTQVPRDHHLHLIEEKLLRLTALVDLPTGIRFVDDAERSARRAFVQSIRSASAG